MLLNEKSSQNANGSVQVTVHTFHPSENKGVLTHLSRIFKHDIVGFFREVRNILRQTEGLEAYATCKQSATCSDAIEEYHVHIPPMYDEILTDKPVAPTPGSATLSALTSAAQAAGLMMSEAWKHSPIVTKASLATQQSLTRIVHNLVYLLMSISVSKAR